MVNTSTFPGISQSESALIHVFVKNTYSGLYLDLLSGREA